MPSLKTFDAYARPNEDIRVRTASGGIISIISAIIMVILVIGEISYYLQSEIVPEISLDTQMSSRVNITFDVTFPHVPCAYLGVDVLDVAGGHQLDISHSVFKQRQDKTGNPVKDPRRSLLDADFDDRRKEKENEKQNDGKEKCGGCYGAESNEFRCCNTCEDVKKAYQKKNWVFQPDAIAICVEEMNTDEMREQRDNHEGCRVYGSAFVNKVAGNFHIAPGVSEQSFFSHVHSTSMLPRDINTTHIITTLRFGPEHPGSALPPLSGRAEFDREVGATMMTQYFVTVVPTTHISRNGAVFETNEYSATAVSSRVDLNEKGGRNTPGMFVIYDMSPIMIVYRETSHTFAHLLTGICGIVCGLVTFSSLFDRAVYVGVRSRKEKIELGKTF